jgi:hypothetical protein
MNNESGRNGSVAFHVGVKKYLYGYLYCRRTINVVIGENYGRELLLQMVWIKILKRFFAYGWYVLKKPIKTARIV